MRKSDKTVKSTSSVPTVKEVARRAGVSTASVSRALSGSAGVSEPLRSKILEAARSLSYRPNRAARDLRIRSSRAVGVLIPDIENPFFTSLVCGIEDVLSKTDFSLLLASYNEDPDQETRRLEIFRAEGACGLIFAASRKPSPIYSELEKDGLTLVAVSRSIPRLGVDEVTIANREGAYGATSHLIKLGHKRIAMINGPTVFPTARDRQAGYEDALREAGMNANQELQVHCAFKQAAGREAMERLLNLPKPPTAIFAASNLLTLGALQAIHEQNLSIPDQIALVGFDDMPWAMSLRPALTTVAQPAFEAGRTAAEMLLARVRDPSLPRRRVVLETRLIVRSSCGFERARQPGMPRRKR